MMFLDISNETLWFPILSMVNQYIFWVNCSFVVGVRCPRRLWRNDSQGEAVSAAALIMILTSFSVGQQPSTGIHFNILFGSVYVYIYIYTCTCLCIYYMYLWAHLHMHICCVHGSCSMPFQLPDLGLDPLGSRYVKKPGAPHGSQNGWEFMM